MDRKHDLIQYGGQAHEAPWGQYKLLSTYRAAVCQTCIPNMKWDHSKS
jgi:hypothetical protein